MRVLARIVWLVLIVFVLACAPVAQAKTILHRASKTSATPTKITPQVLRGKIIFLRGDDVWMFDPKTRRERMIFKNPFSEKGSWTQSRSPMVFSPDLKRVVFTYQPEHTDVNLFTGNELYVMNLDRSHKKRLTNTGNAEYSLSPRLSPDGKHIAYTRSTGDRMGGPGYSSSEVRVVDIDGLNDHRVAGDVGDVTQSYFDAFWSRDGKRLLFTHDFGSTNESEEGKEEFQTCTIDGVVVRAFDGDYRQYLPPDVSPDGQCRVRVVDMTLPHYSEFSSLFLADHKGQFMRDLLSNIDLLESNPQWSADNKFIIFQATQRYTKVDNLGYAHKSETGDIWSVGADGKNLRRLVTNASLVAVL